MMSSCMAHWAGPSHGASRRATREAAWAKKIVPGVRKVNINFPRVRELQLQTISRLLPIVVEHSTFKTRFTPPDLMEWVLVVLSSFTSIPFFFSHCFCWAFFEVLNWMTQPFNLCLRFSTTTCNLCILTEIYGSITSFDIRDGKYLAHPVLVLIRLYHW